MNESMKSSIRIEYMKKRNKEQEQYGKYNKEYTPKIELRNDAVLSQLFDERNNRRTEKYKPVQAESKEPIKSTTERDGSLYEFDIQELRRLRN